MIAVHNLRLPPLLVAVAAVISAAFAGCTSSDSDRQTKTADLPPTAVNFVPTDLLTVTGARFNPDRLVSGDFGFLGVGATPVGDGKTVPQSWSSTDGVHWRAGDLAEVAGRRGRQVQISGLAATGTRAVAVGTSLVDFPRRFDRLIAFATSDGLTWQELHAPSGPMTTPRAPSISAADGRFIALFDDDGVSTSYGDGLWRSTTINLAAAGCSGPAELRGPALVASCRGGNQVFMYLADKDKLVAPPSNPVWALVEDCVSLGAVRVAVGWKYAAKRPGEQDPPVEGGDADIEPEFRRSEDAGRTWQPPLKPATIEPATPGLQRLAAAEDAVYAVGTLGGEGLEESSGLWYSTDAGKSWTVNRIPNFADEGYLDQIAWHRGRYIATARVGFSSAAKTLGIVTNQQVAASGSPTPTLIIESPRSSPS